jgi:hypothetical protein
MDDRRPGACLRRLIPIVVLAGFALTAAPAFAQGKAALRGDATVWRAVTLDLDGPDSGETATPNPFADYRLDVTFTQGDRRYVVPGYFAACGDAAETGCASGSVWRVRFTPDAPGAWTYAIRFLSGEDAAVSGTGTPLRPWDGATGRFEVAPAGAPQDDPRNRGRLVYDGGRYLKYAATGEPFFKVGADAPENMLAFDGFDATPNNLGLRKSWAPHVRDAHGVDLKRYGWKGRGQGILGAVAYLADQGMNAVSFLTFNVAGDDQNVFPHLMKVDLRGYEALGARRQWTEGLHHDRFDASKLDQWERVLAYANDRGLFLHFKLQETENNALMDGGATGRERTLYLRELVARFGHFLALTWNIGEENDRPSRDHIAMLAALAKLDPYGHLRVLHTPPGEQDDGYMPLIGDRSALTGVSLQGGDQTMANVRPDTVKWVRRSAEAGKPWVVGYDEAGNAAGGAPVDADFPAAMLPGERSVPDDRALIRGKVLWAVLTAGGTGVEYYYGYGTGCTDLNCQDHRTRAAKWRDGRAALAFFRTHVGRHAQAMQAMDDLTGRSDAYVFAKPGERYVVYLPDGAPTSLAVPDAGPYRVAWYDPREGGDLQNAKVLKAEEGALMLGAAPSDPERDWVVLVERAAR